MVNFEADADLDDSIRLLKDKINGIQHKLPSEAETPQVLEVSFSDMPIVTFSLAGNYNLTLLQEFAEDLQSELEKIDGVSEVPILGTQERVIEVLADQRKLEAYGIGINQISSAIQNYNFNFPLGSISTQGYNYQLRLENRSFSAREIQNIPLISLKDSSQPILLKDLAKVIDHPSEQNTISKLAVNGQKAKNTISLQVKKKTGGNILRIVDEAKEKVEELKKSKFPQDLEVLVTNDNSKFIREDLNTLVKNGLQTIIIIIIFLFLALSLKEGIIAGLSIPLTFFITFGMLSLFGQTLNSLALFSMVLALGLLIDTAIVMMEGFHEGLERGLLPKEAALKSINTYKWPVISGTLTTVSAFLPMFLVSGIMGQFLKTIPFTISTVLIASLFVSLIIAPALAAKTIKKLPPKSKNPLIKKITNKVSQIQISYLNLIKKILPFRSKRKKMLIITWITFIASMSIPFSGILNVEMFPSVDVDYFVIKIEAPQGTILSKTNEITAKVEEILYNNPKYIDNFVTNIGTSQSTGATGNRTKSTSGGNQSSHLANITVNLIPSEERTEKSYLIAKQFREKVKQITQAKVKIAELKSGPPQGSAVELKIFGSELEVSDQISTHFIKFLKGVNGVINVENNIDKNPGEFNLFLKKDLISYYKLNPLQVASYLRIAIQGQTVSKINQNEEDIDIILKIDLKDQFEETSFNKIRGITIPTPDGKFIPLSQLVDITIKKSPSTINRLNQKRVTTLIADTEGVSAQEIFSQIDQELKTFEIPAGYEIKFGGEREDIKESFTDLFKSMIVAVLLIGSILVLQFNSFKQPLIILSSLPLALIGVFPGLLLIGLNLSFPAFLGVVGLTGIVVNDAIVLLDQINSLRKEGWDLIPATIKGCEKRLKPIFLTSITTILGILPLALSDEFWAGLGFTIIFGLIFSTFLTLVVIPATYINWESEKKKKENTPINNNLSREKFVNNLS